MKRVLITSALPYANGPLHFGHIAGAYLPGDCYARFQRLLGSDVLYLCGSDEHGVAITLSAELAGRSPKEHVDLFHEINKKFFERLDFSFDHYSRTTWKGHEPTVQEFFWDLFHNGYIEAKVESHLYSNQEKRFLADRYVEGTCPTCGFESARGDECQKCGASYEATDLKNPRSKRSGDPLVLKPSRHWYLRFDLFKEPLKEWIEEKDWKPNVLSFAKNYINDLRPRAITRDSDWGVPVPLEEAKGKVFYVWFDAPIGYISAAKEWAEKKGDKELWKKYWEDPTTTLVHFIGKDNIPFHTVFFPAMIMGQNQPYKLPDEVPANEFYLLEGRQFSKSDHWYIDLEEFFVHYTTDQIRYFLAATAPETADSEFTWKEFQLRCNSELLGKFGNFIHRTLVFAKNQCGGKMPPIGEKEEVDQIFLKNISSKVDEAKEAFETFHLRKASQILMELAQLGNGYFDTKKPWQLKDQKKKKDTSIACCIFCIQCLALIASPIIPSAAQKIWEFLGYHTKLCDQKWTEVKQQKIPENTPFLEPQVLFRKIEDFEIAQQVQKLGKV